MTVRNEWRALNGVVLAAAAIMSMTAASAPSEVTVPDPERGTEQRSVPGQPARGPSPTALGVVLGSGGTAEQYLPVASGDQGIPATVRAAYERAAALTAVSDPGCGLTWEVLAGIGRIESGHAGGGRVDDDGRTRGRIMGVRLDGSVPGTATIPDRDGGALDGDTEFDRAVGPMQFLPGTWAGHGADGNGDGIRDPHNVYDAALAAAGYLCAGGGNLADPSDLLAALFRYNPSVRYGLTVQAWAQAYRSGGAPVIPALEGPVPEPLPAPATSPVAVLAAPAVPPAGTDRLAGPAPRQDPAPGSGAPGEAPAGPGVEGPADPAGSGPAAAGPTRQGTAEGSADGTAADTTGDTTGDTAGDTAAVPPSPAPGPACDPSVLRASQAVVLPDSGGLLLRFPTDELPAGCTITSATLRLDPGAAAAERTVQVERVADEWSDRTTRTPSTVGAPVTAGAGPGERAWSVAALLAALVEGPDHGLLLSAAGDGDPVSLIEDGDARLEIVLGPG